MNYPDFFGLVFGIQGIFVATIAPEMLCGDRRENVLPLYFSRAIKRSDYLFAKLLATGILTLTISAVPAIILWLGEQFLENKPLSAMVHHLDDLGKVLIVGTTIAFYLGAIALTVSAFTGRKSIAVAIIVIGFGLSTTLAFALNDALSNNANRRFLVFLSPGSVMNNLSNSLFNVPPTDLADFPANAFPTWGYLAGVGGIVAICLAIMYWRYVPDE
jgi:ABC-2 type transport system permease protein